MDTTALMAWQDRVAATHNIAKRIAEQMTDMDGMPSDVITLVNHYAYGCDYGCHGGHRAPVTIAMELDAYAGPNASMVYRLLHAIRDNDRAVYSQ